MRRFLFKSVVLAVLWLSVQSGLRAEETLRTGPANAAAYVQIASQSRFDAVVGEVAFPLIKSKRGLPQSGCTGTMLSPSIVLTAAHCLSSVDAKLSLHVVKGTLPSLINGEPFDVRFVLGPDKNGTQLLRIIDFRLPPSYVPAGNKGLDIAVLKVGDDKTGSPVSTYVRNKVAETIVFPRLYSGVKEFLQPSPNIGVSVGFGFTGDGFSGELKGSEGTKRAGLVLVQNSKVLPDISSVFYNSGHLFNMGLPSNFLEVGTAHGDSGGPLFQNIGTLGALVETGVGHNIIASGSKNGAGEEAVWYFFSGIDSSDGKNNVFGTYDYWTKISINIAWIKTAVTQMGDTLPRPDDGR